MKKIKIYREELVVGEVVLTRSQLKKVMGGDFGSSGGLGRCSTDTCTLVGMTNDGTYASFNGNCATHVVWENLAGGIYDCYCKTSVSSAPVSLDSNGGISKCGARYTIP